MQRRAFAYNVEALATINFRGLITFASYIGWNCKAVPFRKTVLIIIATSADEFIVSRASSRPSSGFPQILLQRS